jgi:hypothetical protein
VRVFKIFNPSKSSSAAVIISLALGVLFFWTLLALGPAQPPIHWVGGGGGGYPRDLSGWDIQLITPQISPEIKKTRVSTFTPHTSSWCNAQLSTGTASYLSY